MVIEMESIRQITRARRPKPESSDEPVIDQRDQEHMTATASFTPPSPNCLPSNALPLSQRYRDSHPHWHNAPVDAVGPLSARLIVGLAPGLKGANATGRLSPGFCGQLPLSVSGSFRIGDRHL